MSAFRQIIPLLALAYACFLPASALTPTAAENCVWEIFSIGYDAPVTEATNLQSHASTPTLNYDSAPIHRATVETKPTEASRALFGQSTEFKAGEITILAGQPWRTVLGQYTDAAARARLRSFLQNAEIPEGP